MADISTHQKRQRLRHDEFTRNALDYMECKTASTWCVRNVNEVWWGIKGKRLPIMFAEKIIHHNERLITFMRALIVSLQYRRKLWDISAPSTPKTISRISINLLHLSSSIYSNNFVSFLWICHMKTISQSSCCCWVLKRFLAIRDH